MWFRALAFAPAECGVEVEFSEDRGQNIEALIALRKPDLSGYASQPPEWVVKMGSVAGRVWRPLLARVADTVVRADVRAKPIVDADYTHISKC
jgi:hypothetical protein